MVGEEKALSSLHPSKGIIMVEFVSTVFYLLYLGLLGASVVFAIIGQLAQAMACFFGSFLMGHICETIIDFLGGGDRDGEEEN